ncbi:MAG: internal scaffolding protein [Microvirus sp.]|nr:MAG: internal scaffolding protein [Microvirus sp.]
MNIPSRNPYNYDTDYASQATSLLTTEASLTQQQFKDEADINTIAERFGLTGKMPEAVYQPTFGDFTGVTDFQTALHAIQVADASFLAMPSAIRERFQNDSQAFVAFCSDERNAEEFKTLGLTKQAPPVPPTLPSLPTPTPIQPPSTPTT